MSSSSLPPGVQSTDGGGSLVVNAQRAKATIGMWAGAVNQSVQQLTVRKYPLPDKNVASQILMYRQLLHTKCRPGLKLSRDYQGTPAQKAVLHMPWWCAGILETKKMIISYDNLISRLWIQGVMNHSVTSSTLSNAAPPGARRSTASIEDSIFPGDVNNTTNSISNDHNTDGLMLNEEGMPPTPHEYWVSRLGFQQPDPVTDFRSGGVLSLAMMVWIVESCPKVFARYALYPTPGDTSVLPFGITCINITDMMSKFLLLSKSTDKMDTLLSQKPFWKMFADPSALLVCQELAMDMLADVVQELYEVRKIEQQQSTTTSETKKFVTVFDFPHILSVTEKRVEYDLLGAGPTTVQELRTTHQKLIQKYKTQLETKLQRMKGHNTNTNTTAPSSSNPTMDQSASSSSVDPPQSQQQQAILNPQNMMKSVTSLGAAATSFTGNVFSKMRSPSNNNDNNGSKENVEQTWQQPSSLLSSTTTRMTNMFSNPFTAPTSSSTSGNDTPPITDGITATNNNNNEVDYVGQTTATQGEAAAVAANNMIDIDDMFADFSVTTSTSPSTTNPTTSNDNNMSATTTDTNGANEKNDFSFLGDDWNIDIQIPNEGVSHFSIGGDEDEELL